MQGFSRFPKMALAGLAAVLMGTSGAHAAFETADERVELMFRTDWSETCDSAMDGDQILPIEHWDLTFSYDFEPERNREFRLYRIHCFNGAYNEIHVFYGADEYEDVRQIHFVVPQLDITYLDDDYESSLYKLRATGFTARPTLVNSSFDPETASIHEFSKWRGLGDASSIGEWRFSGGEFVLTTYDVDASYDGVIEHKRVVGDSEPPKFQ